MSSTDSWLLFLNWPFSCWELRGIPFHKFLAARPPEWQALEAGLLVPHMYPTLFQDSWKGNHQIHGEMLIRFFLLWNMSWQMNLIFNILWSLESLERWIFQVIKSDSFAGTSSSHHLGFGARLGPWWASTSPHRCSSVEPRASWARTLHNFDIFRSRNVQQMFSWVRLHLQFIHLPLFPFHYNLLQSPEPWGSSERLCSENGQRDSKRSSVQNIVATLKNDSKKAPKPSSFGKGNACFVRCCSWMDIPPRWWTFYAWPLLGRELMGRHCKGC